DRVLDGEVPPGVVLEVGGELGPDDAVDAMGPGPLLDRLGHSRVEPAAVPVLPDVDEADALGIGAALPLHEVPDGGVQVVAAAPGEEGGDGRPVLGVDDGKEPAGDGDP